LLTRLGIQPSVLLHKIAVQGNPGRPQTVTDISKKIRSAYQNH